jgi:hypothetical protein
MAQHFKAILFQTHLHFTQKKREKFSCYFFSFIQMIKEKKTKKELFYDS